MPIPEPENFLMGIDMIDLPEGFEGFICDKYKMNPVTFKLLYENKYNSDLAAYTAGMAQGRREQTEKDAELIVVDAEHTTAGYMQREAARKIRRAAGEQDD